MKIKHIAALLCVAAIASSCTVIEKFIPTASKSSSERSTSVSVSAPSSTAPNHRHSSSASGTPAPIAGQRPDKATLCGGRWYIVAVDAITIPNEDDMPYIEFEDGTGRFYASDGCNIINGDYLLRNDGAMVFSNVISTSRYCPDNDWNVAIAVRLKEGNLLYVDTKRIGQETYLYLRSNNRNVLTLRRHNMEFLNGNWVVASIDGSELTDEDCTLFIDIAECRLHGNSGCNFFNGNIYINPAASNSIDFSNLMNTHRACPNAEREMKMLVALEATSTALEGNGTVLFLDDNGNEVMTLKRPSNDR